VRAGRRGRKRSCSRREGSGRGPLCMPPPPGTRPSRPSPRMPRLARPRPDLPRRPPSPPPPGRGRHQHDLSDCQHGHRVTGRAPTAGRRRPQPGLSAHPAALPPAAWRPSAWPHAGLISPGVAVPGCRGPAAQCNGGCPPWGCHPCATPAVAPPAARLHGSAASVPAPGATRGRSACARRCCPAPGRVAGSDEAPPVLPWAQAAPHASASASGRRPRCLWALGMSNPCPAPRSDARHSHRQSSQQPAQRRAAACSSTWRRLRLLSMVPGPSPVLSRARACPRLLCPFSVPPHPLSSATVPPWGGLRAVLKTSPAVALARACCCTSVLRR
jgi:hypothetical protein